MQTAIMSLVEFRIATAGASTLSLCQKQSNQMTPSEESRLCDKCGIRLATNYICHGGTGRSNDLCDECLRADDSTVAKFAISLADEAKEARCCYCGGFPCGGGPDTLSLITGGTHRNRWMCMPCSVEYYFFTQHALESITDTLTHEDQITKIKEIGAGVDSHMSAFVARRDN